MSTFARSTVSYTFSLAALVVALASTAGAEVSSRYPGPRPFSAAEREAVRLAAAFLDGGPAALLEEMAPDAALRRLPREVALAEIEVRTGRPEGTEWRLTTTASTLGPEIVILAVSLPSGVEDYVVFRFDSAAGSTPKLVEILGTLDPLPTAGAPPVLGPPVAHAPPIGRRPSAATGAAVGLVLLLAGLSTARPRRRSRRLAVLAVAVLGCGGGETGPSAPPTAETRNEAPRLGALLPLRRIALGETDGDFASLLATIPEPSPLRPKAVLLDVLQRAGKEDGAALEARLAGLTGVDALPLTHLLRVRLAEERGALEAVQDAFRRAIAAGLDCDFLRLRLVEAIHALGEVVDSRYEMEHLTEGGTREAVVYYLLARLAAIDNLEEKQVELMQMGWALAPLERRALFADPVIAFVAARREVLDSFELASAEEPLVEPARLGEEAVSWPGVASLAVVGSELEATIGEARLVVPAGSPLARLDAAVERADAGRRRKEAQSLARLHELESAGRFVEAMRRPHVRQQMLVAVFAYMRRGEWTRILELTENLSADLVVVDPIWPSLRALALERSDRGPEARSLLLEMALDDKASQRRRPEVYYQLAELCAAHGELDLAIRLVQRADKLSPFGASSGRVERIRLERDLLKAARRFETKHFDLVFPLTAADTYVRSTGALLEGERQRLLKWIPLKTHDKVEVHLYPARQFYLAYGGGVDLLGLYDGKVRVPFGNAPGLSGQGMSVMSHELAHALIADYTNDRAPKWLQEGLAQHVELIPSVANPLPDLEENGTRLSFPVVEAVLQGFSEPRFVEIAYDEAAWILHFIEAKHGVQGIHRLLDAFRDGLDTEKALEKATGSSVAEFDARFRTWGFGEGPLAWESQAEEGWNDETVLAAVRENLPAPPPPPPAPPKAKIDREKLVTAVRSVVDEVLGPKEKVLAWHKEYSARVAPVKQHLGAVLAGLKGRDNKTLLESCRTLRGSIMALLGEKKPLESPDEAAALRLREAFRAFGDMATHCAAGRSRDTQLSLEKGEQAIRLAAIELDRYGVKP